MKSVSKFLIIVLIISFPLSLNSQVKIDLKKQVISIDKNAKTNMKKDAAKDQGTQNKQVSSDKKDTKSNEELKANTDGKPATQEQQSMQSFSTYDFVPG